MATEVRVVDSVPVAFAQCVAQAYKERENSVFSLALSGGSSAEPCYRALASLEPGLIDWSLVEVFFGDERMVPISDERSNVGKAKEIFLDALEPAPLVFPMSAQDGPDSYEFLLRKRPPLDFVHLGIGPDGHTASLFPNSSALNETERLVVENSDPSGLNALPRMTLTIPGIARSHNVIFTAFGSAKAAIVRRVFEGADLPAAHITAPRVVWLLDHDAASRLPPSVVATT